MRGRAIAIVGVSACSAPPAPEHADDVDTVDRSCVVPGPPFADGGDGPIPWWPGAPIVRADGRVVVPLRATNADDTDDLVLALRVWSPEDEAWSTVAVADRTQLQLPQLVRGDAVVEVDGQLRVYATTGGGLETPLEVHELVEEPDGGFSAPRSLPLDPDAEAGRPPLVVARPDGALAVLHTYVWQAGGGLRLAVSERRPGRAGWTRARAGSWFGDLPSDPLAGRWLDDGRLLVVAVHPWDLAIASGHWDGQAWLQAERSELPPPLGDEATTRAIRDGRDGLLLVWPDRDPASGLLRELFVVGDDGALDFDRLVLPVAAPLLAITADAQGRGALVVSGETRDTAEAGLVTAGPVLDGRAYPLEPLDLGGDLRTHDAALPFLDACGAPVALTALMPATDVDWRIAAAADWRFVRLP